MNLASKQPNPTPVLAPEDIARGVVAVLDDCPEWIVFVSVSGAVVYCNQAARHKLKVGATTDVSSLTVEQLFPPSIAKQLVAKAFPYAVKHNTWSGTIVWPIANTDVNWAVNVSSQKNAIGEVLYFSVVGQTPIPRITSPYHAPPEDPLRRIIDNILGFVGELTPDGILTEVSQSAYFGSRVSREDVIGKLLWECYWWSFDALVAGRLRTAIERASTGEIVRYDEVIRDANDNLMTIDFILNPMVDNEGKVCRLIASAVDISERRRAERALQTSEALVRSILESSADCIQILDLKGKLLSINSPGLLLWEVVDFAEIRGRHWPSFWPDSAQKLVNDSIQVAMGGGVGRFQASCNTAKGNLRWWDVAVTRICDSQGQLFRLCATSRDTTEQREIDERVRRQAALLELSHDAILVWRLDGGIVQWNRGAQSLYGFSTGEVLGVAPQELLNTVHPQPWSEIIDAIKKHGQWEGRLVHTAKNGRQITVLSRQQLVNQVDGQFVLEINRDITDLVVGERALEEAKTVAEAASRAKSEFLANVSHEIRSPMAAILGFTELLVPRDEDDREKISTILRNGKILIELVNDILDLSKIEAGSLSLRLEPFDPAQLANDVCSFLQGQANNKQISISCAVAENVPSRVVSDPTRLRQILVNLVGNAIKFTDHGSVGVTVDCISAKNQLRFDVVDTGIGIRAELIPKLFQPFEQGDSSIAHRFGGSGLGLTISQQLAHLLGGEITVESEVGHGSKFSCTIAYEATESAEALAAFTAPSAASQANVAADTPFDIEWKASLSHSQNELRSLRVLVVDDRRDIRRLAQQLIQNQGGEVLFAENGKQAMEIVQAEELAGHLLDVILMDIQMPELDGLETTRRLRTQGFNKPIIALTANAMEQDRADCLAAGYNDFLVKPIIAADLINALRGIRKLPSSATDS